MACSTGYEPNANALEASGNAGPSGPITGPPTALAPADNSTPMDAAMGALEPAAATHRVWRNPSPTKDELKQTIDQMYHAGGELLANKDEMEQKLKAQAKAALEFQRAGFQRAAEEAMQQVRDINQVEIVNAERAVQQTMANTCMKC